MAILEPGKRFCNLTATSAKNKKGIVYTPKIKAQIVKFCAKHMLSKHAFDPVLFDHLLKHIDFDTMDLVLYANLAKRIVSFVDRNITAEKLDPAIVKEATSNTTRCKTYRVKWRTYTLNWLAEDFDTSVKGWTLAPEGDTEIYREPVQRDWMSVDQCVEVMVEVAEARHASLTRLPRSAPVIASASTDPAAPFQPTYAIPPAVDALLDGVTEFVLSRAPHSVPASTIKDSLIASTPAVHQVLAALTAVSQDAQIACDLAQEVEDLREAQRASAEEVECLREAQRASAGEMEDLRETQRTSAKEVEDLREAQRASMAELEGLREAQRVSVDEVKSLREALTKAKGEGKERSTKAASAALPAGLYKAVGGKAGGASKTVGSTALFDFLKAACPDDEPVAAALKSEDDLVAEILRSE
ncbi:hypothetical protein Tdes44962_MAKER09405 [Teratosphaeria destructans]|uniref:Uncharacterized protein n=1 Tax=Teratosphaeria destructans TaxID=418781 RepID=A0A9W7STB5_9PEZI|nr:hypothetical protein Tdes44962_MAKER09405 [Teratosphaeria destructans]